MAKNKKLPEIIITGTPQELVEIETLLVMAGYDKVGLWSDIEACNTLILYNDRVLIYCGGSIPALGRKVFKASEIHKILHYIETGEIKEYDEDRQMLIPITTHYVKRKTHTGQTCVVGYKIIKGKINVSSMMKAWKLKKWKRVEKEFKQWANPNTKNGIAYYSPTSQLELLLIC